MIKNVFRANWLALVPTIVVMLALEAAHQLGPVFPVPFLLLMVSVVIASVAGGVRVGVVSGLLASGAVLHSHLVGIGPASLIGDIWHTLAGMSLYIGVGYFVGLTRDQRDANHEALLTAQRREQEEPLLLASKIAKMGYYIWDVETGAPVVVSEQHARNHGMNFGDFVPTASRADAELVHPADRQKVRDWCRDIRAGKSVTMEYRIPVEDGEKWIRAIVKPVTDDAGNVVREICASLDVTEQKASEHALIEAQKLDAVGRLTAGIAHDFNNILTVAIGNLELCLLTQPDSETAELLTSALDASQRGSRLTRQLLAFGRKSDLAAEPVDVNLVIDRMDNLFQRTLPSTIQVQKALAPVPQIEVDRTQLESALLNLAINARDAMTGNGRLTFETTTQSIDDTTGTRRKFDLEPGDYTVISVSDNGCGMSEDITAKIWEPFFTTKSVDKGSGLGMPMVYGFVKQSGGGVQIDSTPGAGTRVRLFFPLMKQAGSPPSAAASAAGPQPAGSARPDTAFRARPVTGIAAQ